MNETEPWSTLLAAGREDGRLVAERRSEAGEADLVAVPPGLHPSLREALGRMGIERLYAHQAQAVAAAYDRPIIVTTGTASGKSMCFNLPTLEVLCREPHARALYLYPTKALAQDQARALAAFELGRRVRPAIYDGDTPRQARAEIRRGANIVLTNPDMLHVGILPNHEAWAQLFANLAVVVLDEAHVYRGVFGSHVGNVLRRLRRIAGAYGTAPRFLLTSATIANPAQLAQRLTGLEDFARIERDGSARPARRTAIWNPPLIDEKRGSRLSATAEGVELLASLVLGGARTICFARSRKGVELIAKLVGERLRASEQPELAELLAPYRAGYTAQQRRELERRLLSGQLRAIVTTDALELGIDIGRLDAAVVINFPGTVASLRQMWGRAGRRERGLAVYVAGEDALDQFFCRHPDDFLERPVEAAILDHESQQIHLQHLLCAAHEGPLTDSDAEFLGPRWEAYSEMLVGQGALRRRDGRDGSPAGGAGDAQPLPAGTPPARHRARSAPGAAPAALHRPAYVPRRPGAYPAAEVSLRSASAEQFAIVDGDSGELIGTAEAARAHSTLHEGAIYLHLGRSYEVAELDIDGRRAFVSPFDGDWYTQPKIETDTSIDRLLDRRDTLGVRLSLAQVSVTETVIAYQRKRVADHAQIDLRTLDLPQTSFATQAILFEPDDRALSAATGGAEARTDAPAGKRAAVALHPLLGALHATEHAQIAVLPLIAMCDRWDIGGLSTNLHPQTEGPAIFIYDGHPGGVGIARTAFERFEELCEDAHRLVAGCPCSDGCPSCVQSPKCGNLNEPLSKAGAKMLLGGLLARGGSPPRA